MRFAEELARLVRDPRYIRVDGRPLVMLYRPGLLPDAAATVQRWRTHLVAAGLGDPLVIMPLVLGTDDPRSLGLDGAAGFPPHRNGFGAAPINKELELLDPEYRGTVVRYTDMVETALADHPTQFRYFPGVCPGWDNEARKPGRGFCVHGATPDAYEHWLAAACRRMLGAENPQERIVFINAWNEWAEGAHLEPDRHHGYAYLARTSKVAGSLAGLSPDVLRAQVQPVAEPVRPRRRARDLPGLVRKNLAYQGAKMAEALARRLRRLM
jgi:lipopolysaccharide biosynthesis protein